MKTFRNYLLALTMMIAAFSLSACGNNNADDQTSAMEMTSVETSTNGGNSGIMNDTTNRGDNNGVIDDVVDDIGDAVETGVSMMNDGNDNGNGTTNNNNKNNTNNTNKTNK